MTKVGLIGVGNYGYALAYHLDRKDDPELDLHVYDRNQEVLAHLRATRTHPRFFPLAVLSERVQVEADLVSAAKEAQIVILATVSTALSEVLAQLAPVVTPETILVSVMKALDAQTGRPLTETIEKKLGVSPPILAVLAGGTTGKDLAGEQYLGATVACKEPEARRKVVALLESPYLRVQESSDVIGVQYAGSLKNLISVVVGIVAGLGFSYGTQTYALSLAASECQRLAVSLGAQSETFNFASQCWGNDMVMSATGQTRNHTFGIRLGEGLLYHEVQEQLAAEGKTAESVNTLAVLPQVADLAAAYPLLHFLTRLAREEVSAHELVKLLETSAF